MMNDASVTFESSIERLDEIVKLLEKGDVPLENALTLFEEGTGLIRRCGAALDDAEQKVVKLMKGNDGSPVEIEFEQED